MQITDPKYISALDECKTTTKPTRQIADAHGIKVFELYAILRALGVKRGLPLGRQVARRAVGNVIQLDKLGRLFLGSGFSNGEAVVTRVGSDSITLVVQKKEAQ